MRDRNASTSGGNTVTVVERVLPLKSKRPRARRYPFAAGIELTDLETEIRIKEQTKDLNLFGCKVDTQKTLPTGTTVRIRIAHAGRNFTALGRVVYARQSCGMGIAFMKIEPNHESYDSKIYALLSQQLLIIETVRGACPWRITDLGQNHDAQATVP